MHRTIPTIVFQFNYCKIGSSNQKMNDYLRKLFQFNYCKIGRSLDYDRLTLLILFQFNYCKIGRNNRRYPDLDADRISIQLL